jgi:hypothetical protein
MRREDKGYASRKRDWIFADSRLDIGYSLPASQAYSSAFNVERSIYEILFYIFLKILFLLSNFLIFPKASASSRTLRRIK